jgi:hypothetical protein
MEALMRTGVMCFAFLVLSLFSSVAQDTSAKPYEINEAYEIYSLVLPHEESSGFAKGTLVIQQETVSHSLDLACFDPKSAIKFKDALADYSRVQKRVWLLQREFQIEKPYELVSADTINLFFKEHGVGGWQYFYERYPDSGGFTIVSPVGFNKTKTLAVVYTGSGCGGLCGQWGFHLFEKVNNKWKEVSGVTCTTVA